MLAIINAEAPLATNANHVERVTNNCVNLVTKKLVINQLATKTIPAMIKNRLSCVRVLNWDCSKTIFLESQKLVSNPIVKLIEIANRCGPIAIPQK